jgi:hypothetical protein
MQEQDRPPVREEVQRKYPDKSEIIANETGMDVRSLMPVTQKMKKLIDHIVGVPEDAASHHPVLKC